MTTDTESGVDVSTLNLEDWLRSVVTDKQIPPRMLANAMIEDGFQPEDAHALAALAYVRYGNEALNELPASDNGQQALEVLRQTLGAPLFVDRSTQPASSSMRVPASITTSTLQLADRTVDVLFTGKHPPVALFGNVLSAEECAALIAAARQRIKPSTVVAHHSGEDEVDTATRTSYGTFLRPDEYDWLAKISARIAELVNWPVTHTEDIALTHYQTGQQFLPHYDYYDASVERAAELLVAGQRIATMVVYLNEVPAGGATSFPLLGYDIKPKQGSATFFTYQKPDGTADNYTLHAGEPVTSGEKWIATFWFVEKPAMRD